MFNIQAIEKGDDMVTHQFEMHYDQTGDVLYIDITPDQTSYSKLIDDNRVIDFGADHLPVGIEFFNVSEGIDLASLPYEEELSEFFGEKGKAFKIYA